MFQQFDSPLIPTFKRPPFYLYNIVAVLFALHVSFHSGNYVWVSVSVHILANNAHHASVHGGLIVG